VSARSEVIEPTTLWRRITRALGTALVVLICMCAASLIALAILARTDPAGVSRVAGHPVLTVLSNSMVPTFRAGDLLVDRAPEGPATRLRVGDVITFKATGQSHALITHRIVAVEPNPATGVSFRTQGDANNAPDAEPVSPGQVVGVYTNRIPYAGYALQATHSRAGLFLLIAVSALLLLAPVFKTWWRASGEAGSPPGTPGPVSEAATTPTATVPTGDRPGGGPYQVQHQ
jgi:signal peptidase